MNRIFDKKSDETELTWAELKEAFRKHYLPANIQADAQLRIEDANMTNQADNYVNEFRVMADESEYDDQALIHIFRKGLPFSLADKILNQPQGWPTDLEGWYKAAIRFDEQLKYAKAVQKPRRFQMARDKKKKYEKKEVAINRMDTRLTDDERKEYMKDGQCFQCAKQGHLSRDCPQKNMGRNEEHREQKKMPRDAYVKIQAIIKEYDTKEQGELLDIITMYEVFF
uniref:CCHC-type domain-containing protein n=1 Tax=Moniliophthora roreri TaxID=221103 RepID=A0A0W0GFP2_MONRR